MSLKELENQLGGFINCHAHFDRAGTIALTKNDLFKRHLFEKWVFVNQIKSSLSEEDYFFNIKQACLNQKKFKTNKAITFIDLDDVVGTRALDAAIKVREEMSELGFDLHLGNQSVGGFHLKNLKLLERNAEALDFLGGLPLSDKRGSDYHIDVLFNLAKDLKKKVHVHVDQLNTSEEQETEWLAKKTIEYGMQGRVVAVHSISLACHPKSYREYVYRLCKDAGLMFVSCPSAWIDHPRSERLSPTHNSMTPIDELLKWGFVVGIGTDNIEDIYKPYCDGDMMFELRLALEVNKVYDQESLINLAYNNGLKIISSV